MANIPASITHLTTVLSKWNSFEDCALKSLFTIQINGAIISNMQYITSCHQPKGNT